MLATIDKKLALENYQLSVNLDADGPSAMSEQKEDPATTQEKLTAMWEAASGIKYDEETKRRLIDIADKMKQNELDRADRAAALKAQAVARASKFKKRKKR